MNIKKEQPEKIYGIVIEAMPNTIFRVKLQNSNDENMAYLSGKMRKNRIKIMVGDKVLIELDKYGGKGRIVQRS